MEHIDYLNSQNNNISSIFVKKATGRYFTHKFVADYLIDKLLIEIKNKFSSGDSIKIIDPFAGDGRLVVWLIESISMNYCRDLNWEVLLIDINDEHKKVAIDAINFLQKQNISINYEYKITDSFKVGKEYEEYFDIVITNPPWELLKPDQRELKLLDQTVKEKYIEHIKSYDSYLASNYPKSQPLKKFAGWGTNLSRVGLELSLSICSMESIIGIVLPASVLADEQSIELRKYIFNELSLKHAAYFPAEMKLYEKADTASCTLIIQKSSNRGLSPELSCYDHLGNVSSQGSKNIGEEFLSDYNYTLPIYYGIGAFELLEKFSKHPTWKEFEDKNLFWAGREIDETGSSDWLSKDATGPLLFKGRMINRFQIVEYPTLKVGNSKWTVHKSIEYKRIAWRDISRMNQKRRVIATILPEKTITGNSLGVMYFKERNEEILTAFLGVFNSLCFEFQLRSYLATGHISLSSLRKVRIPNIEDIKHDDLLIETVNYALQGNMAAECLIEVIVAKRFYHLNKSDLFTLLEYFPKLSNKEKNTILNLYDSIDIDSLIPTEKLYKKAIKVFDAA